MQDDRSKLKLSHIDSEGHARMVDVGEKAVSQRESVARAEVHLQKETLESISQGSLPKGDVLAVAKIAGIQAAKRTSEWIPLCHPLALDAIDLELTPDHERSCVCVEARASVTARTGVEMEALVAVAAASLTVYDMCKAVDRGMTVDALRLVRKSGGKSGTWLRPGEIE